MGFFGFGKKNKEKEQEKMKTGLEKTRTGFWGNILNTLTGSVIDDDMYDDLEEQLILADVGGEVAVRLVDKLRDRVHEKGLKTGEEAADALRDIIAEEMTPDAEMDLSGKPAVILVIGVNGVGKTTLSRCLCGLLKEQAGQILLNGKHLDRKGRQRSAFCVMQDVNHQLFSDSVWGECRMSAPEASDDQISEVLDSLHLLPFRERHPMALSGGQKQRLAVATALLSEKPVLIFDEPTSGLDYDSMVRVSRLIEQLSASGVIVFVVSHDFEFIVRTCTEVVQLDDQGAVQNHRLTPQILKALSEQYFH